jgi:hypothetical protein
MRRTRALDLAQLEERLLLSAAPPGSDAVAPSSGDGLGTEEVIETSQGTNEAFNQANHSASGFGNFDRFGLLASSSDESGTERSLHDDTDSRYRTELVFIDVSVQDHELLVADLQDSASDRLLRQVVLLDGARDGIAQISEVLAVNQGLDAVHFVSHGAAGAIKLGSSWLNLANVQWYGVTLQAWSSSLAAEADLLFYGCNVAADSAGRAMLQSIRDFAGANVAASVDDTGNVTHGGDWDLEYQLGGIESAIAFGADLQANWSGVLAVTSTNEFIVDTVSDLADGDTSSWAALLTNKGPDGRISLREAILTANKTPNTGGPDLIRFDIAGSGTHTISLTSALPTITEAVFIDGWSEPDFSGTPVIELNGAAAGSSSDGLRITAGGSTIRGLIINRFGGDAIELTGRGSNQIQGNYLGTSASGMVGLSNGLDGIRIDNSANNLIGGTSAADRNVISSSDIHGIRIIGTASTGNLVQGNFIGTDSSGHGRAWEQA